MIAQAAGFRRLVADDASRQRGDAGRVPHRRAGAPQLVRGRRRRVQLDLTADNLLQDDADLRDWQAAVRSLQSLVDPTHVVVIGAGRSEASPGRRVLDPPAASRSPGGSAWSIQRPPPSAASRRFVSSTSWTRCPIWRSSPCRRTSVAGVVGRCGAAGVPTAVVISAGFAELGPEGSRRQDEVLAAARRHGMRLVGPNCLGVVSTSCGLNATFTEPVVPARRASPSPRSPAGSGSPSPPRPSSELPASPRSCRWATRSTSAATTCCACGPMTNRRTWCCCTSNRSVTRSASPGLPAPSPSARPIVALKSGRIGAGTTRRPVAHRRARQRPGDGRRPVRPHRRAPGPHAGGADRRRTAARPPAGAGRAPGRPRSATPAGR